MDRITLQNYRCFGSEEQTARLAPLTLLVGPNSSGKTSFLALIRALWDTAFLEVAPDFREPPYDLGSFDDIVYRHAVRGKTADSFTAGFEISPPQDDYEGPMSFQTVLTRVDGFPHPSVRTKALANSIASIESALDGEVKYIFRDGRNDGEWVHPFHLPDRRTLPNFHLFVALSPIGSNESGVKTLDQRRFERLIRNFRPVRFSPVRPFASAPLRASPQRTYDPASQVTSPQGEYIPSYLASLSRQNADEWQLLKGRLEKFGKASELFDEIDIRSFGQSHGDPFQVQVRKHSGPKSRRRKGPWRNLIDVGYGVSQALPLLTEMLRPDAPSTFLLQQPEVHLHPQAQAALGTLFCQIAAAGRQLIVETHSDYIIDRVRMDVRDATTELKPEDVSILYFEPGEHAVKIHSIEIDQAGNLTNAPPEYRQFFTDEMMRSIGL